MDVGSAVLDVAALRQLTNPADIPRLLSAALVRERAIDTELEGMLGRREAIQAEMLEMTASTSEALQMLAVEAEALEESTAGSANLAQRVSSQVRALDATQTRVQGALSHIAGLLGRAAAVEGVARALAREDYEAAVHCVDEYLTLEEQTLAALGVSGASPTAVAGSKAGGAGVAPPAEHGVGSVACLAGVSAEQAAAFAQHRRSVEEAVSACLTAAVAAGDHAAVLRFAALHPPLRQAQRGLDALLRHLAGMISSRAAADHDALVGAVEGTQPDYVGALTNLFKDVASAVDEHLDLFINSFGLDLATTAVLTLHGEVDLHGSRILQRYADHRRLARLAGQVASHRAGPAGSAGAPPVEPRAVEACLEELLALCGRSEEYTQYILLRLADVAGSGGAGAGGPGAGPGAGGGAPGGAGAGAAREASIRGGGFAAAVRELLSHYISLEEYYMEESVAKALAISGAGPGDLTSSAVDDVFFVLAKAGERALGTGRAPSAVAVLNGLHGALTSRFCAAVQEALVGAAPRLLAAAGAGEAGGAWQAGDAGGAWEAGAGAVPAATTPSAAATAALPFNDAEVAAGHAAKLRARLEGAAAARFRAASDRDRVLQVLADLGKAAADLRALSAAGAAALAQGALGALRPALDAAAAADLGSGAGDDSGSPTAWAADLAGALEVTLLPLRPYLVPSLHQSVVMRVLDGVLARLEAAVAARRFSQLGGLALERDLRLLAGRASELAGRSVRDRFARLAAVALLLGLESVAEAADLWAEPGGGLALRLSEGEVRAVLAQRREWSQDEISRLRLA
ncbi:COG4 [Auxenochlorella protothecoides x Auxenochlorella symbiontica]